MDEILSVAEMRRADALAIAAGTPGRILMERAGEAVAAATARLAAPSARIAVLCGVGHNGGDGYVAARLLAERGFAVTVAALGAPREGDAALAAGGWTGPVHDAAAFDPGTADLIVDALFGAGLARPIAGGPAALIERLNRSGRPVLAVDLPSGLDGDTGAARGPAVQATETVTFARLKPGHCLTPGRRLCGRVVRADIGIGPEIIAAVAPQTRVNGPAAWPGGLPRPDPDGHKFGRGHALAVSGGPARTGAARLAARGALRIGAGLVTLASPRAALAVNGAHLSAVMLAPCDGPADLKSILADARINAVVLGPGLGVGAATRDLVAAAAAGGAALVLDADGLTSFADDVPALRSLIAADPPRAVLTPHGGEFARLFGQTAAVMAAPSRLARARAAAACLGAVVVDKGPDTVIAAPDGRAAINGTGTPYLATAGSGDVLAGFIAGLLAQGMPPFAAACAGVWLHGRAGEAVGPGLIAEDLPERLPAVLGALLGDGAQTPSTTLR